MNDLRLSAAAVSLAALLLVFRAVVPHLQWLGSEDERLNEAGRDPVHPPAQRGSAGIGPGCSGLGPGRPRDPPGMEAAQPPRVT